MPLTKELFPSSAPDTQHHFMRLDEDLQNAIEILPTQEQAFASEATSNLLGIALPLENTFIKFPREVEVNIALNKWLTDATHGVRHSFAVYNLMSRLRESELAAGNQAFAAPDEDLKLRAILHDLGEFIPLTDRGGMPITDTSWQFRRHAQIMSLVIRVIGRLLEVDDAQQLALDIRHHDFFWSKPTEKQMAAMKQTMSPAGQLLADADRLVGENVAQVIHRNRSLSLGKWYFLRPLTATERSQWKVRTGGLFDGMAALVTEFSAQDHNFYTDTGKALNQEKQKTFQSELIKYYQEQYQLGWQKLEQALTNNLLIEIGMKSGGKDTVTGITDIAPIGLEISATSTPDQIRDFLNRIMNLPVPKPPNPDFLDRSYHGYSIRIDGTEWIDPSILRFANEAALEAEILKAIAEYQEMSSSDSPKD